MFEVRIAILIGFEGQDETMRKTFVMVFFADIGSPIEAGNLRDLVFESLECFDHFIDLLGRNRALEFEADHMMEFFRGGNVRQHKQEKAGDNNDCFHAGQPSPANFPRQGNACTVQVYAEWP